MGLIIKNGIKYGGNIDVFDSLPIGYVYYNAVNTTPPGGLRCDGTSYLRTTYPVLFEKIGTTYGSVDNLHFNVPNIAMTSDGLYAFIKAEYTTSGGECEFIDDSIVSSGSTYSSQGIQNMFQIKHYDETMSDNTKIYFVLKTPSNDGE